MVGMNWTADGCGETKVDCRWGDLAFEGLLVIERRRIRAANPRACSIVGVSSEAALIERDLRDLFGDDLDDLLAREDGKSAEAVETVLHRLDGGRLDVEVLGRSISADPPRTCLAIREIGDRKHHEAEIRNAHRMEAVGQVAAGLTHEVRNLVTAILGHAKLARSAAGEDCPAVPSIDAIETAARNIALVTRSLGPIPSGVMTAPVPTDLAAVLRAECEKFRQWLPPTVDVVAQLPDWPVWVLGDVESFRDIAFHLVSNARDAMPSGGRLAIQLEVVVAAARPDRCRLTVSDTGVGMSPDVRARVFEPFFTTKPRGLGHGVGLKIVMGIVQRMGGVVEVESEARRGTRVMIDLPVTDAPPPAKNPVTHATGRGEVVLVAEDYHLISGLIVSHLRGAGFEPLAYVDGESAIRGFEQNRGRVRAALLDIELPGRSGLECLAAIRAVRPELPVILMSGHAAGEFEQPDPCTEIVRKPFQVKDLIRRVAERIAESDVRMATGGS